MKAVNVSELLHKGYSCVLVFYHMLHWIGFHSNSHTHHFLTNNLSSPSQRWRHQPKPAVTLTLQKWAALRLRWHFSKNPHFFFFSYMANLLLLLAFVRLFCRETERAGKERLVEKQQRRRQSGQPAAQEKQRDGENAVRTQAWPRPHIRLQKAAKSDPARETERTVVC